MTKAHRYMNYLREEGYVPRLDEDGDVLFKYEGRSYVIYGDEHDAALFRLVHPFVWHIQSDEELDLARDIMNDLNTRCHVVKFYESQRNVWASIELLLESPEAFTTAFPHGLRLLAQAANRFVTRMKPEEEWTV